jgi:phosphoserine phosphatase
MIPAVHPPGVMADQRRRGTVVRTMSGQTLRSWRPGATRQAIVDFVERTVAVVPVEERVAVFDDDGTLWCEKPMPIQLDFITRRLAEMVAAEPALRERQPWKAVAERDHAWFGDLMPQHYAGDDTNVRLLTAGILTAHADISVEEFERHADAFLRGTRHPTLGRGYLDCGYAPMVELLQYLAANGFTNYIASGGGRDFIRPVTQDMYGVPRERVIGSSLTFRYAGDGNGGVILRKAETDYLDDGPEKPVRIWNRVGRRPLLAAGNSSGDLPMLEFAHHADRPTLRLLVRHDDGEREFDYTAGAERALDALGPVLVRPRVDDTARTEPLPEVREVLGRRIVGELGFLLRVEVVEVAEELVEAVHRRQMLVPVAQVVLAELPGGVPVGLQRRRDGGIPGLQPASFGGDAVDVGRPVAHQTVAVAAQVRDADVVTPDDENVGPFRRHGRPPHRRGPGDRDRSPVNPPVRPGSSPRGNEHPGPAGMRPTGPRHRVHSRG